MTARQQGAGRGAEGGIHSARKGQHSGSEVGTGPRERQQLGELISRRNRRPEARGKEVLSYRSKVTKAWMPRVAKACRAAWV